MAVVEKHGDERRGRNTDWREEKECKTDGQRQQRTDRKTSKYVLELQSLIN